MRVFFDPDSFDWISDDGLITGETRYDLFGFDAGRNPVVLNVNLENFETICRSLASNGHAIVEASSETMAQVLARMPIV